MQEMLKAIHDKPDTSEASWVRQSVGLTIAVLAIVSAQWVIMDGRLVPIQQQVDYVKDDSEQSIEKIDEKLQIEIQKQSEASTLEVDRAKARLNKLEEWQRWWYRNKMHVLMDCSEVVRGSSVSHLYRRINYQRVAQLLESIEGFTRMVKKELEEAQQVRADDLICDKECCRDRKNNDHDRDNT